VNARALALGVLWGIAVGSIDAVGLPIDDESWPSFWRLLLSNMVAWSLVGVCIAWLLDRAQWRIERPWFLAFAVAAGAPLLSAVASLVFSVEGGPAHGLDMVFPKGRDMLASFLYQAWIVAFYGGLFALAWAFNQRGERTRTLLAGAQVARLQSETRLAEAQIQSLRGHVDPGFLTRVMRSVEERYPREREEADLLLNRLITFLRLAMPGLRSGTSTLAAELVLAKAYAELSADADARQPEPAFEIPDAVPDMPFPPLLLLPLVSFGLCRVVLSVRSGGANLAFYGNATIQDELAYRVRVALSRFYDTRWSMSARTTPGSDVPALMLSLET
jgi:hypothetical protein